MRLSDFTAKYPPAAPQRAAANPDELRKLGPADGVAMFTQPPAQAAQRVIPKMKGDSGCHLWVIEHGGIPYVLERAGVAPPLQSGRVTHTNLTGGAPASCGGEVWVDPGEAKRIYVNGCSGRYRPQTAKQLEDAVAVLAGLGFEVVSFGWDDEAQRPAMVLR